MRGFSVVSTVGTTKLALGDNEWIPPWHQVFIKQADSVATALSNITVDGQSVYSGAVPIEDAADTALPWSKTNAMFTAGAARARLDVTLGGTVAGCRTDILIVAPGEPTPFGAINRFGGGNGGRRRGGVV